MEKVAPSFDFEAWRDASPTNVAGKSASGTKIELGGRIVQANPSSKGTLIVAEQLPIAKHPVYGPTDAGKRTGTFEFVLQYPEQLPPDALRFGNRFVVVGTTEGRKNVVVDGAPKSDPFLVADCIHVWQTGRSEIASFKEDVGAGFSSLPEQTYCVQPKK
jgi:starvation-inducible outer membrane lipoprotein